MKEATKLVSIESEEGVETVKNSEFNGSSAFRVCATNLPEKTSFFTKLKNVLFYEIKLELTPYEQKVENELNEFLHQEITWEKVKDFLFKEVEITHKGKKIF